MVSNEARGTTRERPETEQDGIWGTRGIHGGLGFPQLPTPEFEALLKQESLEPAKASFCDIL